MTRILIGSVMNFCVISKISCGRVALNRTTWTHLKRIRIVILDSITSTFTADYKPLWVTWLDFSPTFAGISRCFQMQEVGFHVSHLPQLLFAWTFFSPYVYLSLIYKNNPFFNLCEFQHLQYTEEVYHKGQTATLKPLVLGKVAWITFHEFITNIKLSLRDSWQYNSWTTH